MCCSETGTRAGRPSAPSSRRNSGRRTCASSIPAEAGDKAGLDGTHALLIIGFESADLPQGEHLKSAVAIARGHGGLVDDEDLVIDDGDGQTGRGGGAVGAWRQAFIGVNAGATNGLGLLSDTFETAITWDRWQEFDATVRARMQCVLDDVLGDGAFLSCRFTHVYPDGPAPYYTFSGAARPGAEAEQWQAIKDEAMAAVVDAGGTVTHHHAVGRMHRPAWGPAATGTVWRGSCGSQTSTRPERNTQSGRPRRPRIAIA